MQIVIDIPEHIYEHIKEVYEHSQTVEATYSYIYHGTPLPKGHGNLIQREDAETIFKNARKALLEQSRKEQIKDLQTREMMLLNAEQFIHLIHPIIEAESEVTT
jgi:hypothetical protein